MINNTALNEVWEYVKIIGIPVLGFIAIRFINAMDKLRKDVNILINKMSQREVFCNDQHTTINDRLKNHDGEISKVKDTLVEHGESISKINGILKVD